MEDFSLLRKEMVETQLRKRGLNDERILRAFLEVPREEFVPFEKRDFAYQDLPLSIGFGQTISQPYIVALMTQVLAPQEGDKILEVGTGSGYQSAILAYLGARVYSIERMPALARRAEEVLTRLGYKVKIKVGDGTLGWKEEAPFKGIIVTAASFRLPPPLIEQLQKGGRIVIPLGGMLSQTLTLLKEDEGTLKEEKICGCVFVPLIGEYGFKK